MMARASPIRRPGGPRQTKADWHESHPGDIWVFGYGSLMWRPGFAFAERRPATLRGHHRALCVYSHHHRGTAANPGLVLGLDYGGTCRGLAYRIPASDVARTVRYLREREQVTSVYLERIVPVTLDGGPLVPALTYTVDRTHHQYAGRLDHGELLRLVRQGQGVSGNNPDYVLNTVTLMHELGIDDPTLRRLAAELVRNDQ
jgi:glutathione-specific gamma-glutamylcyclotransferase